MTRIDLKSKSIEELWALHEEIASILTAKMEAEAEARNAARPNRKEEFKLAAGTSPISEGLSKISKSRSAAPDMVRSRKAAAMGSRIASQGKTAERLCDLVSIDGCWSCE
jgi:hypothetical protein